MAFKSIPKKLEDFAKKHVPTLRTYLQKEGLRDTDKLIRDEVAKRVNDVRAAVDQAKQDLVTAGGLKGLDRLDQLSRWLNKIRDTIKYDSRGYRGVFDPEEVADRELEALIDFDLKLFSELETLQTKAQSLAGLTDAALASAVGDFEGRLRALESVLDGREKFSREELPNKTDH